MHCDLGIPEIHALSVGWFTSNGDYCNRPIKWRRIVLSVVGPSIPTSSLIKFQCPIFKFKFLKNNIICMNVCF